MGLQKLVIYQLLPRLFGNMVTSNVPFGTITENGCGKFDNFTDTALKGIAELGITHLWYTGVIAHAGLTDYSDFGIPNDAANVVKGRAGSPYAIRDYYDVDPDLAVVVENRMIEFESLLQRTHQQGLKVIIDFVPNHVARSYSSLAKPADIEDFGLLDDRNKAFSPENDFYYVRGKTLVVPKHPKTITTALTQLQKHPYHEFPAKATGNDVFSELPQVDDWYETIKLNYGVDYTDSGKSHFSPIPPLWKKMKAILLFWAQKGIDGFRCDMVEMVPVDFWGWVIQEVKSVYPDIIFVGEAYQPQAYGTYFNQGKFDFLYDKVGLYDTLKRLIRNEAHADVAEITSAWHTERQHFPGRLLAFLENHDEERIASSFFAGNAFLALPAMVVAATLSAGPVMLYAGQEVGEPALGEAGFSGDDGRTTIFDYWSMPEHQKWMNKGAFDGKGLSPEQLLLRNYYKKLMQLAAQSPAIADGEIIEIPRSETLNNRMYGFFRYNAAQRLLIVANFDRNQVMEIAVDVPDWIIKTKNISSTVSLLDNAQIHFDGHIIYIKLLPVSAQIIEF